MAVSKATRITVTLMLTHQCNLNCVYCYEKNKSNGKIMSADVIKDIIRSSFDRYKKDFHEIVFDLMGGEPLLEFKTIKEIAEWAWGQNWPMPYLFYATTNGTLVHGEIKEWFSRNKEKIVLGLSYDGDSLSQDFNRSNSSSKVDLTYFAHTWPFQRYKMTISPESLSNLYNSVIYLHSCGIVGMFASFAYGVDWGDRHIDIFRQQLKMLVDYYLTNKDIIPVSLLSMNIPAIFADNGNVKYCGAGTGMIFYNYDGKPYPCHLLSPVNLDKNQLKAISGTDYCNGDDFAPSVCRSCVLYNICPSCSGMNYLYLGDFKKRFPFMCRAIKVQVAHNMIFQYHTIMSKHEHSKKDVKTLKAIKKLKELNLLSYV